MNQGTYHYVALGVSLRVNFVNTVSMFPWYTVALDQHTGYWYVFFSRLSLQIFTIGIGGWHTCHIDHVEVKPEENFRGLILSFPL